MANDAEHLLNYLLAVCISSYKNSVQLTGQPLYWLAVLGLNFFSSLSPPLLSLTPFAMMCESLCYMAVCTGAWTHMCMCGREMSVSSALSHPAPNKLSVLTGMAGQQATRIHLTWTEIAAACHHIWLITQVQSLTLTS